MLIFAIYQTVVILVIKRTKDAFSLAVIVFRDFWGNNRNLHLQGLWKTYFDETVVNVNSFTLVMSKVMKSHLCQLSAQVLCIKLSKGEQDEPGRVCDLLIHYISHIYVIKDHKKWKYLRIVQLNRIVTGAGWKRVGKGSNKICEVEGPHHHFFPQHECCIKLWKSCTL